MQTTDKEFKRLLSRLTPATVYNEACVRYIRSYEGDLNVLLKVSIDEMSRSSLNSRVKQINFLEYCAGIVGNCESQPEWIELVATNLQRIVDAAIPAHLSPPSLVNVIPSQRFVQGYFNAGFIEVDTFNSIMEQIKYKEHTLKTLAASRKYRVTKEEVLRRMEDDRERAKKYKERELAVLTGSDMEFERMWKMEPAFTKKDREVAKQNNDIAGSH